MSEHLPDSFDPQQPDLPSLGVDPDPVPEGHDGEAPTPDRDVEDPS